jgi:hypothetical protein
MLSTARKRSKHGGGNGPKLSALGYAGVAAKRDAGEPGSLRGRRILFDVPFDQRANKAAASLGIDFRLISNRRHA